MCSFSNSCQCYFQFESYRVAFFDLSIFHLLQFPSCLFVDASHILPFSVIFSALILFYFSLSCSLLFLFLLLFLVCSLLVPFSAPPTLPPPPSPSSAHVDMSTVAFDVDPLDLDAEEPPEFQGDPRSSKGMSGSVTSPQANAHRLPFFKKVTLGAPDTSLTSPASLLHLSLDSSWSGLTSPSPSPSLTNCSQLNRPCRCCSS